MKLYCILFSLVLFIALNASAQNVGIGETSPASKLSVKGSLSVGSAYSGIAAPADGAIIMGHVGIGTTAPGNTLTVNGTGGMWNSNMFNFYTDAGLTQKGFIGNFNAGSDFCIAATTGGNWMRIGANNSNIAFFPDNNISTGGLPKVVISSAGSVGIGTIAPTSALQVLGTTSTTNFQMTNAPTAGYLMQSDAAGNGTWVNPTTIPINNIYNTDGILTGNRTVTMGTDNLVFSSSTGQLKSTQDAYFNSVRVGMGTGSIVSNTAIGGLSLGANSTGNQNTAVGYSALTSNTIGNSNTALGNQALTANISGGDNTATGVMALPANSTGSFNTATGKQSMLQNLSGSNNTAVGWQAGATNTTGSSNTFVGYMAYGATNNLTNAASIGANALVTASNSLVLGSIAGQNGASASTNVGIGTTAPGTTLDVNGGITHRETIIPVFVNNAIIPSNVSQVQLTGGAFSVITIIPPAPPNAGQELYIYNNTVGGFPVSFGGASIPVGAVSGFIYTNGAWLPISSQALNTYNIYTSNGSLTGSRTVNMAGNNLTFTGGGSVGIGTITPTSALQVLGTTSTTNFQMTNAPTAGYLMQSDAAGNGTWVNPNTIASQNIYNINGSLTGPRTVNMAGNNLTFTGGGSIGIGETSPASKLSVKGSLSVGSAYSGIAAPADGAIILGNVGIGTSAPGNTFTVNGTGGMWNSNMFNFYTDAGLTQKGFIGNFNAGSDFSIAATNSGSWMRIGANNSNIAFFPDNALTTGGLPKVVISSAGSVGIGEISPASKLSVKGSLSIGSAYSGIAAPTDGAIILGNVGIGTSAPGNTLTVNGSGGMWNSNMFNFYTDAGLTQKGFIGNFNASSDFSIAATTAGNWMRIGANNSDIAFFPDNGLTTGGNPKVVITSAGSVGIGTIAPGNTLTINGSGGMWNSNQFNFYTDAGLTQKGFIGNFSIDSDFAIAATTAGNWMRIGADNANIAFFPDGTISSGAVPKVVISSTGYVGIGTSAPAYPLDISVTATANPCSFEYINAATTGNTGGCAGAGTQYSIHSSGRILTAEVDVQSDHRIKTNITAQDPATDLDKANALKVVSYEYIDKFAKGANTKTGFIAQQVEYVLPNAISKSTDVLPNVFEPAKSLRLAGDTLFVTTGVVHDFVVGDEVLLYGKNNKPYDVKVESVIDSRMFTVGGWTAKEENIFVYGKKVNDFRTVDFDQITATCIGAIQELDRKLKEEQNKNQVLQQRFDVIQQQNTDVRTDIDKLKASIESLKQITFAKSER